jgi:glycosyltransferase involved in cell wall biosynthesis
MNVAFDAHTLGQRQTGNETYVLGLLHGLEQIGFSVHAYGFVPPPTVVHPWRRLRPHARAIRIPIAVPLAARRDRLDLYHGTWAIPPVMPCPSVVTVHDLTFLLHPEWFRRDTAVLMGVMVGHAVRKAARVITISERTKEDIVERYLVPAEQITVTYLAPRPAFSMPVPDVHPSSAYFLHVGNIQPRKNVGVLIRALAILRDRDLAVPLVLAGQPQAAQQDILIAIRRHRLEKLVRFTGYVSDDALRSLYAGCTALVHPALYEGFGLTPLEAMAMGRPVIAADAGSIPEVVGDGALLVPPGDAEGWADAMEQVLCNEPVRCDLARRGLMRAAEFSWERCARETVGVYERALRA